MSKHLSLSDRFVLDVPVSDEHCHVGKWVKCLSCHRCYRVGEFRSVLRKSKGWFVSVLLCPYSDCDEDYLLALDWLSWLSLISKHTVFPDVPCRNVRYALNYSA